VSRSQGTSARRGGARQFEALVAERGCIRKALRRRLGVPRSRRLEVLRDASAVIVEDPEVELGLGVALRRRLGVPRSRRLEILRDACAVCVEEAKAVLGAGVALRRRLGVPRSRSLEVLRDA